MIYRQDITGCIAGTSGTNRLSDEAFEDVLRRCDPALDHLRKAYENRELPLLHLPDAGGRLRDVKQVAENIRSRASQVVVLGTGGSSLGGRTLAALSGGSPSSREKPKIHFLDSIDPCSLDHLLENIDLANTVFIAISKSGRTISTIAQLLICLAAVSELVGQGALSEHFIVITEPGDNPLRRCAARLSLRILDHDPHVGGRFSVLSLVGQLPAMIVGVDSQAVLAGSRAVLQSTLEARTPRDSEPACGAALAVAMAETQGITLNVLMPYCDRLQDFALWHRQLFSESLGKNGFGITPINAMGTVDQHSQLQLYLDGPPDKFFTFITTDTSGMGRRISYSVEGDPIFDELHGHAVGDLMEAEHLATVQVLLDKGRPVRRLQLGSLTEEALGGLLMHFMLEVILAADLLGLNAFDQPAVEHGKSLASHYLENLQ